MRKHLPSSAGVCYSRGPDGNFSCKPMQSKVGWSIEAIKWLDYMQSLPLFKNDVIQHALNVGEKTIIVGNKSYKVDGYARVNGKAYILQYDGCAYHHCDCKISKNSKFEKIDDKQRNQDLSSVGELMLMKSCDWKRIIVPDFQSSIATFFNSSKIIEADILEAVAADKFYGLILVDIWSPPAVVDHFMKLNHPPIFKHLQVEEDMVNETFRDILKERKTQFPLPKQLSLCFNAENYLLTTDLALFYLRKGLKLTNLRLAIEYPKTRPLKNFVNLVTNKRKEATRLKDNNLQQTFKLVMNSSYGRLGLNLENRKYFVYKKIPKQPAADCKTKKVNRVTMVNGEFDAEYIEIEKPKLRYSDSVPGKRKNEPSQFNLTFLRIIFVLKLVYYSMCLM